MDDCFTDGSVKEVHQIILLLKFVRLIIFTGHLFGMKILLMLFEFQWAAPLG